jgi:prevent-host-death family protein
MRSVNIRAARTHLSRLIDQAAAGEEIVIMRAGKPIARLVALEAKPVRPKRKLGILAGQIRVSDDFDAPLPDKVSSGFEGR